MKRPLTTKEEEPSLPELPPEMWLEILSHLTTRQLHRYVTVCVAWPSFVDQSITTTMCVASPSMRRLARLRNLSTLVVTTASGADTGCCLNDFLWPCLPLLVANLTSLDMQYVDVGRYAFQEGGHATLSVLTNLTSLRLTHADKVDGLSLRCLTNLTELTIRSLVDIGHGSLCDDDLCGLGQLKRLRLVNSAITDVGLSKLTALQRLKLRSNAAITSASLAQLTGLTRLAVTCNLDVTAGLSTRLLSLKMNRNKLVTNAHIQSLTGLQSLSITNLAGINSEGIQRFGQLTRLVAGGIHSAFVLDYASLLTNLRSLQIDTPVVGDCTSANRLLAMATQLTTLCIRHNNLLNEGLRKLASLTSLDLSWGSPGTLSRKHFMALPVSLCTLSLAYNNSFLPPVYDTLERLTNLTTLELSGETKDFIRSASFQRLTALKTLCLVQPNTCTRWEELGAIQALVPPTINIIYRR